MIDSALHLWYYQSCARPAPGIEDRLDYTALCLNPIYELTSQ